MAAVHPYYPLELELPGVQPLVIPFERILAVFFAVCGLVLAGGWALSGARGLLVLSSSCCSGHHHQHHQQGPLVALPARAHKLQPPLPPLPSRAHQHHPQQAAPSFCRLASVQWCAGSCAPGSSTSLWKARARQQQQLAAAGSCSSWPQHAHAHSLVGGSRLLQAGLHGAPAAWTPVQQHGQLLLDCAHCTRRALLARCCRRGGAQQQILHRHIWQHPQRDL